MPLADSNSIKEFCFVRQSVADKADKFVSRASIRLKEWISASVYDALVDPSEERNLAKQAESLLAMAFALPQLNMRFSDLGGITKMVGIPGENSEELMSLREVKMYVGELENTAFGLIESLVPELDDDPDKFSNGSFGIMASQNFAAGEHYDS